VGFVGAEKVLPLQKRTAHSVAAEAALCENSPMKKLMALVAFFLFPILVHLVGVYLFIETNSFTVNVITSLILVVTAIICIRYSFSKEQRAWAIALGASLLCVIGVEHYVGYETLRAYAFRAERVVRPHLWSECASRDVIPIPLEDEDAQLQICRINDPGGYFVDVVVRITGNAAADKVLDGIYSGAIDSGVKDLLIRKAGIWSGSFSYHRISGRYYLLTTPLD
jgi:hypothetical protein